MSESTSNGKVSARVFYGALAAITGAAITANQGSGFASRAGWIGPPETAAASPAWERRGQVIDGMPDDYEDLEQATRSVANSVTSLAAAIQAMTKSVDRLEREVREHDRDVRRGP